MFNWRGEIWQVWCSGIQGMYAQLVGGRSGKFGVAVFKASMLDWGRSASTSAMFGLAVFKASASISAQFGVVVFKACMLNCGG